MTLIFGQGNQGKGQVVIKSKMRDGVSSIDLQEVLHTGVYKLL